MTPANQIRWLWVCCCTSVVPNSMRTWTQTVCVCVWLFFKSIFACVPSTTCRPCCVTVKLGCCCLGHMMQLLNQLPMQGLRPLCFYIDVYVCLCACIIVPPTLWKCFFSVCVLRYLPALLHNGEARLLFPGFACGLLSLTFLPATVSK